MVQFRSEHERIYMLYQNIEIGKNTDLPPMSSKQCHQIIELIF